MSIAQVNLLGPVEAWTADGDRIDLGSARQKALLAFLSLRVNAPVSVEALVDAVWDAPAPPRARDLVYTYVSRLRRRIEPEGPRWRRSGALSSAGGTYTLWLPPEKIDVNVFEQKVSRAQQARAQRRLADAAAEMGEALSMWRGEPLAGLPGSLLRAERSRMQERYLAVRYDRLELQMQLGRHREVVPELLEMISEFPLQERLVELLMIALYRSGRQGDALRAYADIRRSLDEELGIKPGPDLQDLYVRILRADGDLTWSGATDRTDVAPAAGTAELDEPHRPDQPAAAWIPPAQLPRDIADFVGRADETARIVDWLSASGDTGVPVVAIAGRGGVGKTTLAAHAAHQVRSLFPDGQLYVHLRGVSDDPVPPARALEYFLQSLGSNQAQLPGPLEERAAYFRTWLANRRVLIVLDDARTEEQVRPLIPGSPGSAVLITSRTPLVGVDDARHLRLSLLDDAEGLDMLRRALGPRRVDAEPGPASEIIMACAGLPLAIHIAAGKLVEHPHWPLRYLSALLRDESRRLDGLTVADRAVRSSIALTVNLLEPAQNHAFMVLSLVDLPSFDVATAAAALGTAHAEAASLVDALIVGQLVDVAAPERTDEPRVRFHDLVRLYAREQAMANLDPADRRAALVRVLDRYVALATIADASLPLNSDSYLREDTSVLSAADAALVDRVRADADGWFTAELGNVLSLAEQAARTGLDSYPWRLLARTALYYQLRTRPDSWPEIGRTALRCARRAGDPQGEAQALYTFGKIEQDLSEGRHGTVELQTALELFRRIGDRRGEVRALKQLGQGASLYGDPQAGLPHIVAAIQISDEIGDDSALADALVTHANLMLVIGDATLSRQSALRARGIYQRLRYPIGDAQALTLIAACHRADGDEATARKILLQCLSVVEELRDLHGQACVLRDLGMLHLDNYDEECAGYLQRCLTLSEELRLPRVRGQALYAYGLMYGRRGDRSAATRLLSQSLRIMERIGNADWQQRIRTALDRIRTEPDGDVGGEVGGPVGHSPAGPAPAGPDPAGVTPGGTTPGGPATAG